MTNASERWGLATALALAALFLAAGFWNPPLGLPMALAFLIAAHGIYRHRAWSAYGAAMVLAALVAGGALAVSRLAPAAISLSGAALAAGVLSVAAAILWRAGYRMPGAGTAGARAAWIALAAVVLLLPQVCRAYVVATGSMQNTFLAGDQLLVTPITGTPARGEIVQFRYPKDRRQVFLKRVVAVGGDRVRLRNKQLILNGAPVNEPYATHGTDYVDDFRDNFPAPANVPLPDRWAAELRANLRDGELLVPAGKLFVLGDNRDDSLDSRHFGFIDPDEVTGRPMLIYFSSAAAPGSPVLLHPSHIRWGRILRTP